MIFRAYANWQSRHRNRVNFCLHMVGIPACFALAPVLLIAGRPGLAGVSFAGGYILQFLGHAAEGNRSGEEILLRRIIDKS